MLIYFNGDSYCAGAGLNDETLPKYPGKLDNILSNAKNNAITEKWFNDRSSHLSKFTWDEYVAFVAEAKYMAWPQKLCNLYNAECINGAESGSSTLGILHRTSADLLELKTQNRIPDKVFIQLTSPYRTACYKFDPENRPWNRAGYTVELSAVRAEESEYYSAWIQAESDDSILYRWVHQIHLIKHVVHSITGKNPVFVDSCFIKPRLTFLLGMDNTTLKNMVDDIDLDFNNSMESCTIDTDVLLPCRHMPEEIHERFANHLFEKLK